MNQSRIFKQMITSLWVVNLFFFSCLFGSSEDVHNSDEKPLVIMVASYQNKNWYKKNLDSMFSQKYENYRIIYVDDCSPDGTGNLVEAYVHKLGQDHRFTLIQNETRIGSLANKYKIAHLCKPNEIIVDLDGDDWFFDGSVLSEINTHYQDSNVWITYGGFMYVDRHPGFGEPVKNEIIKTNSFRENLFGTGTIPLRTFYAGLFQLIHVDSLMMDGVFFQTAGDLAFMFPILEMSGFHSKFTPKVKYVYNTQTGINDCIIKSDDQKKMDNIIRSQKKYLPLQSLEDFM